MLNVLTYSVDYAILLNNFKKFQQELFKKNEQLSAISAYWEEECRKNG